MTLKHCMLLLRVCGIKTVRKTMTLFRKYAFLNFNPYDPLLVCGPRIFSHLVFYSYVLRRDKIGAWEDLKLTFLDDIVRDSKVAPMACLVPLRWSLMWNLIPQGNIMRSLILVRSLCTK